MRIELFSLATRICTVKTFLLYFLLQFVSYLYIIHSKTKLQFPCHHFLHNVMFNLCGSCFDVKETTMLLD